MDTPLAPWPEFLRQRRLDLGLTQEQVAAHLGIRQSDVSRWERRSTPPPLSAVARLTDLLEMTADDVLAVSRFAIEREPAA